MKNTSTAEKMRNCFRYHYIFLHIIKKELYSSFFSAIIAIYCFVALSSAVIVSPIFLFHKL